MADEINEESTSAAETAENAAQEDVAADIQADDELEPLPQGYEEAFAPEDDDAPSATQEAVQFCTRITAEEFKNEAKSFTERSLESLGLLLEHRNHMRRIREGKKRTIFQTSLFAILVVTFVSMIVLSPWKQHTLPSDAHQQPVVVDAHVPVDAAPLPPADAFIKPAQDHVQHQPPLTDDIPV